MDPLQSYVAENRERWLAELCDFLRIPSISTLPDHAGEVRRGADYLCDALKRIGAGRAEVIPTDGHPLVYAEKMTAPGKPTVLFYGHYDVQPPDPLNEWVTAPFEPTVRNGNLYGRGSADDKGQVMLQLKAVEALEKTAGKLPVNLKFIYEGEEETGGAAIAKFVPENKELLKADSVIVCDTELFEPGLPTLCIGLRGMVYTEIEVEAASHDLHSGLYGGVAPNPLQTLAWIIAELKGRDGKINLPGLYDKVIPPNDLERASWLRLPFDAQKMLRDEIGSPALEGESQLGELERMWARPTLEVHGESQFALGSGSESNGGVRRTGEKGRRISTEERARESSFDSQRRSAAAGYQPSGDGHGCARFLRGVDQGNGLRTLRRLDSGGGVVPRTPGNSQRDDGLRPARRQSARAQREIQPVEFLSRCGNHRALPGRAGVRETPMPEMSEERLRWMRNRFVEMVQRTEEMSDELFRMREELNQVVDHLASMMEKNEEEEEE